ncbi:hypothetical protein F2Q69_00048321 [Brassica cretica]|uniref:Uncharacterized protein n=1 Tax=Brassica cretica TaxID=69181 RepID=A0A8S9PPG5_BRACR|nr:hypothetical protein F2Q69_00048321 [Brassica cretica]
MTRSPTYDFLTNIPKHEISDKSSKKVATQRPNACSARSLRIDRARAKARSLRSNRAERTLRSYVATELEPKLGRYVATERLFRSIATQRPSSSETSIQH